MFIYSHLILVRYSNFKELTPRGLINYILVILKCLRMVFKVRVINRRSPTAHREAETAKAHRG